MTAKEYLEQIHTITLAIKRMGRQVISLETALTGTSANVSDMPGAATPNIRRMQEMIATKIDLEQMITEESAKLTEITKTINAMPNETYSSLLTARYIAGMEWRKIADELRLSESHLYQIHREALSAVDKIRS